MSPHAHTAAIALGSNLGDRAALIRAGVQALSSLPGVRTLRASTTIQTPALVLPDAPPQPPYLNAAVLIQTDADPESLMRSLLAIERTHGRDRSGFAGARWSPRTLDLDLLWYDDLVLNTPLLTLPHPELHRRPFVLIPLAEIAPAWRHPTLNATPAQLLARLDPA